MFRVFSLLLLTLILHVQLLSPAPISADEVQFPSVVGKPGQQEHTLEKRKLVEGNLLPDASAPVPEEAPAKEEVLLVREKDPVSQQPAAQEAFAVVSQQFSEETVQVAPKEATLDENVEADLVNSEPPEQDEEAPEAPAPILSSIPEEEETHISVPAEPETDEDQTEPASEEMIPEDSANEDLFSVPVAEEQTEPGQDTDPVNAPDMEEGAPEEDDTFVPTIFEGDSVAEEETTAGSDEEDDSLALVPAEYKTEEFNHVGPAEEETTPEDSIQEDIVIVVSDLEEQKIIVSISSSETKEEALLAQAEEDSLALLPEEPETDEKAEMGPAAEETVPEDPAIVPAGSDEQENTEALTGTPEEDNPRLLVPIKDETESKSKEETAPEPVPEEPTVIVLVGPTNGEPSTGDPNLTIPLDDAKEGEVEAVLLYPTEAVSEQDPDEDSTAAPVADTDAAAIAVAGGNHARILPHTNKSKASLLPLHDEPVARVNRGVILGGAFFTLMSFIVVGFVGLTISKKLR